MAEIDPPDEIPPAWRAFTPDDSPRTPDDVFQDPAVIDLGTPKLAIGDPAFNFDLEVYDFSDGTKQSTGERFNLALRADSRPVALIFGSYT